MSTTCPRCGVARGPHDPNHDYACLETMLMSLYQLGVRRGLQGQEGDGDYDDQGASLINEVLALAWPWHEAAAKRPAGAALAAAGRPLGSDADIDTQVARLLHWEDVGWLDGRPVSGEAAWRDPRVVRRRFSQRLEDAERVRRHPLLAPYRLLQVHRRLGQRWEWHVVGTNRDGDMETIVRDRTAPLALCRAAVQLAAAQPRAG